MIGKMISSAISLILVVVMVFLTLAGKSGLSRSQGVLLLLCGFTIGMTIGELFSEIEKRITKTTNAEVSQKTKALAMIGLVLVAMIWVAWLSFAKNK